MKERLLVRWFYFNERGHEGGDAEKGKKDRSKRGTSSEQIDQYSGLRLTLYMRKGSAEKGGLAHGTRDKAVHELS